MSKQSLSSFSRFSILCLLASVLLTSASAQSTETELVRDAAILDHAVVSITDWGEHFPNDAKGVVGSAFFVNQDGYFVTAGHVLEGYKPGKLTAIILQRNGSGGGQWFEVIEKDDKHDLALCKIAASFEMFRKENRKLAADADTKIVIPNSLQLAP